MASDPLDDSCPNLFDEEDDLFKPSTEDPLCVGGEDGKGSDADLFEGCIDDEIDISDTPTGKEAKLRLDDSSQRVAKDGRDSKRRDSKSKDLQSTSFNYQYNGLFDSPAEVVPVTGEVRLTPPTKAGSAGFGSSVRKVSDDPAKDSNLDVHLNIDIEKYEKRGEGVGSFVVYKVVTKLPVLASGFGKREYSVWRRFSDFLGLHDSLAEKYIATGRIIPPAPSKNVIGMTKTKMVKGTVEEDPVTCEFLERRRASLERYIRRTALHPVLVQDPIFRDFITLEGELPRAIQTAALSVSGVRRLWDRVSDTLNKMACKMDDNDAWFNEKQYEIEQLDDELRKLNHKTEQLVNMRKEYAHSTEAFCKSLSMLTACEENTSLSRALSLLCETMEKISQVHQDQAEKDFFILSEMLKDYIALIDIVKACKFAIFQCSCPVVFFERVKAWNYLQTAQQTLNKRREYKCRLELAGKTERLSQAAKEVDEWSSKLTTAEANFESISKNIQKEYKRFELHRVHEFKQMLIHLLETIASSQQQIARKMFKSAIFVSMLGLLICATADEDVWSCQTDSDCWNGGNCTTVGSRNTCVCSPEFAGQRCHWKFGNCNELDCQNGGSCDQIESVAYRCLCSGLYEGTFCEKPFTFRELWVQWVKRNTVFVFYSIVVFIIMMGLSLFLIYKINDLLESGRLIESIQKKSLLKLDKAAARRKMKSVSALREAIRAYSAENAVVRSAATKKTVLSFIAARKAKMFPDVTISGYNRIGVFSKHSSTATKPLLLKEKMKALRERRAVRECPKRVGKTVKNSFNKLRVISGFQK
ncbi:Sorting nexin-2 [Trichinella pseudospiralis]|uniref:Sorting nexin-2 n=1 Tax=Trichinella pseudospiralis TaxID=6337 RepID=A0A0V1IF93_TRIPS|nr:Sorting nexin-2 [Trichinella pseudospiralis]